MNKIQHYQKYQFWYEASFIIFIFALNAAVIATSKIMEASPQGTDNTLIWKSFLEEGSSAILLIILVPLLSKFIKISPLNWQHITKTFFIYLAASVVFSVIHVSGMFGIRALVYWVISIPYDIGELGFVFLYEYRKDFMGFILMIAGIKSYHFILSQLQGEASLIADGEDNPKPQSCERLLVKKLGKEFIIKIEDIEWLESSGNYVNLHIKGRIYPTRATLGRLLDEIADKGFCRIHRSHGVNLDVIDSITPLASGDSEIKLHDGKVLNLSRRYKEQLKSKLY